MGEDGRGGLLAASPSVGLAAVRALRLAAHLGDIQRPDEVALSATAALHPLVVRETGGAGSAFVWRRNHPLAGVGRNGVYLNHIK